MTFRIIMTVACLLLVVWFGFTFVNQTKTGAALFESVSAAVSISSTSGSGYDPERQQHYYIKNAARWSNSDPIPVEYQVIFDEAEKKFGCIPTILYLQNDTPVTGPAKGPGVVISWQEGIPAEFKRFLPVGTPPEAIAQAIADYDGGEQLARR